MTDSLDNLQDLYEEAKEKKYTGKTEYGDLISRVAIALQTVRQQEIDKLSEINDSINNAQSALIDKIQAQIDAERQARENAKTEKNITDSEASILALIDLSIKDLFPLESSVISGSKYPFILVLPGTNSC